ncbi:hypothetical protein [Paraburkholderia phosphatilytica]|uniref:hypothetical protein n=1 Tax=Paraburkholderia phosphatilytica TaxID=2282883 RepID=UPI003B839E2A
MSALSVATAMRAPFAIPLLCIAVLAGSAHAASRKEQEKACRGDAFRLCAAEIPSRAKIEACMKAHYDELSPPCKEMFDEPDDNSPQSGGGNENASSSDSDTTRGH